VRLFIAFDLPAHIVDFAVKIQKKLRESGFDGTFPQPEHMHVTMLFLGEIPDAQGDDLIKKIDMLIFEPFTVEIDALEYDNLRHPRVIWIALKSEKLNALIEQLSQLLTEKRDTRPVRPHITLARIKRRNENGALAAIPLSARPAPFYVDSIKLKQSQLLPSGPKHTDVFVKHLE